MDERNNAVDEEEFKDFSTEAKKDILRIIEDSPSLVKIGDKEYEVRDMRYYSLYRICSLVLKMKKSDETLDDDNAILTALCMDLDAMCEIVAIILCNHYFTADGNLTTFGEVCSKNDNMISIMKAKVMQSTFDTNQWAAIIIGAIRSIDLSGFFLLKKSVSMLTDSLTMKKKKSMETASRFMEAVSLQTQRTSSEPSHSTE
jgi:hypothetical protein